MTSSVPSITFDIDSDINMDFIDNIDYKVAYVYHFDLFIFIKHSTMFIENGRKSFNETK